MNKIKYNKNTILISSVLALFVMCSSVFAVTFDGPSGPIPNDNSQPEKFAVPTSDCGSDQFISFNSNNTPNYNCIDDNTSSSFVEVLSGLADQNQGPINDSNYIDLIVGKTSSISSGSRLEATFDEGLITKTFVYAQGPVSAISGKDKDGNTVSISEATTGNPIIFYNGVSDSISVADGTEEQITTDIVSALPVFWSVVNISGVSVTQVGDAIRITPDTVVEITNGTISNETPGFEGSVISTKVPDTYADSDALCETENFLAGFENGEIKCNPVAFVSIAGLCAQGTAVAGVGVVNEQKIYTCKGANTILEKTNVILDKALYNCQTGDAIKLENGELGCVKLPSQISAEPIFLAQEEVINFRDIFCQTQKKLSDIIDTDETLILTGFEDTDYSNENLNHLTDSDGSFSRIVRDFIGEAIYNERFQIGEINSSSYGIEINNLDGNDFFGIGLDIHGDTIVIGSSGKRSGGIAKRGAVYTFERVNGVWEKGYFISKTTLLSDDDLDGFTPVNIDIEDYYQFGRNVAIYGDTLVVSAHNASYGSLSNAGIVYIFTRDTSGEWTLNQTIEDGSSFSGGNYIDSSLTGDLELSNNDAFGSSVDIYKDRIAVSAFGNDDGGSERGAIYTFRIDSSTGQARPEYFFTTGDGTDADERDAFVIQNITDPGYKNEYGYLALGDETLAVGIHYLDDTNSNSGGVIIYEELSGGGWSQTLKISNNTGASGKLDINTLSTDDNFGTSVAIENNVLIVGSRHKDHGGTDRGAAYTFIKKDGEWTKQYVISDNNTLTATELDGFTPLSILLEDGVKFGGGVAISGSNILISSPPDNDKKGHVYVFDGKIVNQEREIATENGDIIFNGKEDEGEYLSISDTDWSEVESISLWTKQEEVLEEIEGEIDSLDKISEISDSTFSTSVSYSDGTLALRNSTAGTIDTYEKDSSGEWSKTSENRISGSISFFSYSDDTIAVGSSGEKAVYIFEKDSSGDWSKTLEISDNAGGDGFLDVDLTFFPDSLSYSDDTLVVGDKNSQDNGGYPVGAVYIFERDSSGVWSQTRRIVGRGDIGYRFGASVSYSDDTLAVGALTVPGNSLGDVLIFERDSSGVWSQTFIISNDRYGSENLYIDLDDFDEFGHSISYSDDILVVGASGNGGDLYVFEKDSNGEWSQTPGSPLGYYSPAVANSGDLIFTRRGGRVDILKINKTPTKNKNNPTLTLGSRDKGVLLDYKKDDTNNNEPSIYFDVTSETNTNTTNDTGLYIPTAAKSWNHIVIINRGVGGYNIYRNKEFLGRKNINDFPGLLPGAIGKTDSAVANKVSLRELIITKEDLTDQQIISLYNQGEGINLIEDESPLCDIARNGA